MRGKSDQPKLQLLHSPVEIERKFLVANDGRRQSAVRSVSIRDGLIAVYKDRKVRVRIAGDVATIAIKGPRIGIVRPEFEYQIPIADAERMLSTICQDDTLEKQRFFVEDAEATWYVDVYSGLLQGVIIAEIELKQESQELSLPRWIGKEVTGDPFYKKINMRARALSGPRVCGATGYAVTEFLLGSIFSTRNVRLLDASLSGNCSKDLPLTLRGNPTCQNLRTSSRLRLPQGGEIRS